MNLDLDLQWKWGPLKTYPESALLSIDIPGDAKKIFVSPGLPDSYHVNRNPEIIAAQLDIGDGQSLSSPGDWSFMDLIEVNQRRYRSFAKWIRKPFRGYSMDFHGERLVCIEEDTGTICLVNPTSGISNKGGLVNSSLLQYWQSIIAYRILFEDLRATDDERKTLDDIESVFESIDADAMVVRSFWWWTIFDMRMLA